MQIHRSVGYRRYLPDLAVSDPRKQYGNRHWSTCVLHSDEPSRKPVHHQCGRQSKYANMKID